MQFTLRVGSAFSRFMSYGRFYGSGRWPIGRSAGGDSITCLRRTSSRRPRPPMTRSDSLSNALQTWNVSSRSEPISPGASDGTVADPDLHRVLLCGFQALSHSGEPMVVG